MLAIAILTILPILTRTPMMSRTRHTLFAGLREDFSGNRPSPTCRHCRAAPGDSLTVTLILSRPLPAISATDGACPVKSSLASLARAPHRYRLTLTPQVVGAKTRCYPISAGACRKAKPCYFPRLTTSYFSKFPSPPRQRV